MTIAVEAPDRFVNYLTSIESQPDLGALGYSPGLTAQPMPDTSGFPIVADLECAYSQIAAEIAALDDEQFHGEMERVTRTGLWRVFMLFERGRKHQDHCARCPVLTDIIERHRTVRTISGISYIS